MEALEESQVLSCFGASLYSRRGRCFLVHQCGRCQLWSLSARVPRVEVKDSTESLMMLLIVWEVFAC